MFPFWTFHLPPVHFVINIYRFSIKSLTLSIYWTAKFSLVTAVALMRSSNVWDHLPPPHQLILSRSIAVPWIIHLVHHHHQFLVLILLHLQAGPDKVFESDFSFLPPVEVPRYRLYCLHTEGTDIFRRTLSAFWWARRARFMTYSGSNTTLDWIDWMTVCLAATWSEFPVSQGNGECCKTVCKVERWMEMFPSHLESKGENNCWSAPSEREWKHARWIGFCALFQLNFKFSRWGMRLSEPG